MRRARGQDIQAIKAGGIIQFWQAMGQPEAEVIADRAIRQFNEGLSPLRIDVDADAARAELARGGNHDAAIAAAQIVYDIAPFHVG